MAGRAMESDYRRAGRLVSVVGPADGNHVRITARNGQLQRRTRARERGIQRGWRARDPKKSRA